jgi:1-aminocyclopropane-1-carboxylate deaminase/D-cysteine desulfhydrase-like pyridoxal-dependent ACC family enzyme
VTVATALAALMSTPMLSLAPHPTPVDDLKRLRAALGPASPRVLMKRDDLLSFGMGGNKVRKMQAVAAEAVAAGADALITCGGIQSNHARVVAATGAALGMPAVLILNGTPPDGATGNLKLDRLFGAEVRFVARREDRAPAMDAAAAELRAAGRRPYVIPLGASTPTGAIGFAHGVAELAGTSHRPHVIIHASSSGGTQAGVLAGCALLGLQPRVIGVSADEPAASLAETIRALLAGIAERLVARGSSLGAGNPIEIDDMQVGPGYGVPTPASTEATELLARTEGVVLDPVYTAKAMASLVARVRRGEFAADQTVLFWHTGSIGYFAG